MLNTLELRDFGSHLEHSYEHLRRDCLTSFNA